MKSTQAWGWLAAAVLAAGLNAAYHDGSFAWAHRIADQAQHVSGAVVALASGRADRFLAEAETLTARNNDEMTVLSDTTEAQADREMARAEAAYARVEAFSAREQAHCARIRAEHAHMAARIAAHHAVMQGPNGEIDAAFRTIEIPEIPAMSPVRIEIPQVNVHCSHVRMNLRAIQVPAINVSVSTGSTE